MTFASEDELSAFVSAFESHTLPGEQWKHAAHIAVAAAYLWQSDSETVLPKMRNAIRTYNVATGGQNTEDDGYHETLTAFWLKAVEEYMPKHTTRLRAVQAIVDRFGEKRDYWKFFYSFDVVRSREARAKWIPPDCHPLEEM